MKTEIEKLSESLDGLDNSIDKLIADRAKKCRMLAEIGLIIEQAQLAPATVRGVCERIQGVLDGKANG